MSPGGILHGCEIRMESDASAALSADDERSMVMPSRSVKVGLLARGVLVLSSSEHHDSPAQSSVGCLQTGHPRLLLSYSTSASAAESAICHVGERAGPSARSVLIGAKGSGDS